VAGTASAGRGQILMESTANLLLVETLLLPYIDKKIHHLLQVWAHMGIVSTGLHLRRMLSIIAYKKAPSRLITSKERINLA